MNLLLLPILIPFFTAILCIIFWKKVRLQRGISVVGSFALLFVALKIFALTSADNGAILSVQMGNWQAPIGITFVADLFSSIMLVLAATVGIATMIFSTVNIDEPRVEHGFYPLTNFMLMGICGAFLTGDFFNLYVWFEVLLLSSFVLLGLGGEREQLLGTTKYVLINLLSSGIFLVGLGLLYGLAGTLNMADVARQFQNPELLNTGMVTILSMLFFVAFAIKAALFPFYFWLPASYHTPPISISAIFAGLLTKVGVYSLIRVFTLVFVADKAFYQPMFLSFAGLTMLFGVFGAMTQMDIRKILSFHIVSQIGYMIMGLGLSFSSKLGLIGAIFYIMHHIIVKANLFLIAGVIDWLRGTFDLKYIGGLSKTRPLLTILFFISAMSLAGLPPLSGFWAKFTLVRASIEAESYGILAVSLIVSLFTMYSMTKIWNYAFWHKPPEKIVLPSDYSTWEYAVHLLPVIALVIITLGISFSAEAMYQLAENTATQLLDPQQYINAVNLREAIE